MKRRLAFLAGTLGQGGAEKQLYHLLRALRDEGATIHLLCLTRGEFWEAPIQDLGIPVTWVGGSPSRAWRLWRMVTELRAIGPELIQSQHFYTNPYAGLAGRILRIPSIGAIRNDLSREMAHLGRLLGPLALRWPSYLVANSEAALRNARSRGIPASRLALLRNAIEVGPPAARRPESGQRPLRIVTAARLVRQKRLDRFLRIVARLSTVPLEAAIYGDGPGRAELERQAAELGLHPPRLRFNGLVSDPARIYAEADLLLFTSDWEGTPNVVLEAMAAGLPVVTTQVGDLDQLIINGVNGYCLQTSDEPGMAAAILRLLGDQPLRFAVGHQARQTIAERFSLPRYQECVTDLYQRFGTAD